VAVIFQPQSYPCPDGIKKKIHTHAVARVCIYKSPAPVKFIRPEADFWISRPLCGRSAGTAATRVHLFRQCHTHTHTHTHMDWSRFNGPILRSCTSRIESARSAVSKIPDNELVKYYVLTAPTAAGIPEYHMTCEHYNWTVGSVIDVLIFIIFICTERSRVGFRISIVMRGVRCIGTQGLSLFYETRVRLQVC